MSSYTQLMQLSRQQTKAADAVAATAAAQLQRKLEEQRKARVAREAKERELELRLRKQRLEEAQREEERQARKEQERQLKLKAIAAREAQQRDALLYGPKKAKSDQARQRDPNKVNRSSRSSRSQSPESTAGPVLTREELREQKKQAEMRRTYSESSSSSSKRLFGGSKRKSTRDHLAGGAVPIVTTTVGLPANLDQMSGKSLKERIQNVPLTLTKLNLVKRDVRTIDEILRDREKERQAANKVISGADAKEFSDWFSKGKKKESGTPPLSLSRKETPPLTISTIDSSQKSNPSSRSGSVPSSSAAGSSAAVPSTTFRPTPVKTMVPTRPQSSSHAFAFAPTAKATVIISTANKPFTSKLHTAPVLSAAKKRPRSRSFSPEPAPSLKKRAVGSGSAPAARSYLPDDVFSLITGGRSRGAYKCEEEDSDFSDMEADAASQEREERISARLAKKEDEEALLEIKRHEEEKRRRRLQKEREVASKKKVY